eukprot:772019-Pleurochrysis_carterae.AAC.7
MSLSSANSPVARTGGIMKADPSSRYISSGFATPPLTHAATHARTHATARRPLPAVAQRARHGRGTRLRQLASARIVEGSRDSHSPALHSFLPFSSLMGATLHAQLVHLSGQDRSDRVQP